MNAGHIAPILLRHAENRIELLEEGGPVLGLLSMARYSAGNVKITEGDTLILYSDGISETANQNEDFGEARIQQIALEANDGAPGDLCERIMSDVRAFASAGFAPDDRTLLVVKFPRSEAAVRQESCDSLEIAAVA